MFFADKVGVSMDKMLSSPHVVCCETDYKNEVAQEKYELARRFHKRHQNKQEKAYSCSTFKLWGAQNSGKFGFIPLEDQVLPQCQKVIQATDNLLNIHKLVKARGTQNFMKAQVRVPSQRNAEAWQKHLIDYWYKTLTQIPGYPPPLRLIASFLEASLYEEQQYILYISLPPSFQMILPNIF